MKRHTIPSHYIVQSLHPRRLSLETGPDCPQHPSLIIQLDSLSLQQRLLLRNCDSLSILGPTALEAAQRSSCRHDTMARHIRREGIPPKRVPHGSRRRPQICRKQAVCGDSSARNLAECCPHALLKICALAFCYAKQLWLHVCGNGC